VAWIARESVAVLDDLVVVPVLEVGGLLARLEVLLERAIAVKIAGQVAADRPSGTSSEKSSNTLFVLLETEASDISEEVDSL
jgi:hypothetical protein